MNTKVVKHKFSAYPMYPDTMIQTGTNFFIPFGKDNYYPNFLMDLLNKSSMHSSIQYGKAELTVGQGITWDDSDLIPEQKLAISKLYYSPNPDETLDELLYKITLDNIIFGQYALEIIWSKDRESIAEIYHMPFDRLRFDKPNDDGDITHVWYSADWRQYKRKNFKPERLPLFDLNKRQDGKQIMVIKNYNVGNPIYSLPTYASSIPYILTDWHISQYHLNGIQSGLSPDFVMNVPNMPDTEQQDQFYYDFEQDFLGATGQKTLLTFSDTAENAPTIIPIESSNDTKFLELVNQVNNQILISNRITSPMLVGVKESGQLSGASELNVAFDLYYNQVIKSIQAQVLKSLNKVLTINGVNTRFEIIKPELINNQLTEGLLSRILLIDELREMIGKEDLENNAGKQLL